MKWNDISVKPDIGQYLLMEDHEGNWTIGIYDRSYIKFPNDTPTGPICKWTPIKYICQGDLILENGIVLTEEILEQGNVCENSE